MKKILIMLVCCCIMLVCYGCISFESHMAFDSRLPTIERANGTRYFGDTPEVAKETNQSKILRQTETKVVVVEKDNASDDSTKLGFSSFNGR